jgi:hypothetical protein
MEKNMSHPLLRTLIAEMVESYLEESYEDDLVESIFEEVSDETWEAIEEAILNELSPELAKRYHSKAFKSRDALDKVLASRTKHSPEEKAAAKRKYRNRLVGQSRAKIITTKDDHKKAKDELDRIKAQTSKW